MARLGRNEDVRVEVFTKICVELGCTMDEWKIYQIVWGEHHMDGKIKI